MNRLLSVAVSSLLCLLGCNFNDGPCYRRQDIEGPDGAGGGVVVPGQGGFGDVPPEPQDSSDPEPVACDSGQADDGTCGDLDADAFTGGDSYVYCSEECESKCLGIAVGAFSPAVFKFMTTLPDDGQDKGGGWQEATATLKFGRLTGLLPETWSCTVTVGMPLRTAVHGKVSAETAATVTAAVATQASANVRKTNPDLPPGIFCSKFTTEMETIFAAVPLKSYGARVK